MSSRFTTSPFIKMTGIVFGCFTALLESGVIGYIFISERIHIHLLDVVFLAIGATFGLVVAVMWIFYAPQEKEAPVVIHKDRGRMLSIDGPTNQEKPVPPENSVPGTMKNQEAVPDRNRADSVLERKLPEKNSDMNSDNTKEINGPGKQFQNPLRSPVGLSWLSFIVPKEGDDPEQCADKCAEPDSQHIQNGFYRFAVTDGASASFLPAQWAHILARSFVDLNHDFNESADGIAWLRTCSQQWSQWVDTTWIPQLGRDKDWGRDKAQGAQATLIGCSFSYQSLQQIGATNVIVIAVGDANFFLVRPLSEDLNNCTSWSFPCTRPEEFGPVPDTLATAEELIPQTQFKPYSYVAQRGDYLFLMTDALAQWTLSKISRKENPWQLLSKLSIPEDFRFFVLSERDKGELESDDTTMLRISIT